MEVIAQVTTMEVDPVEEDVTLGVGVVVTLVVVGELINKKTQ